MYNIAERGDDMSYQRKVKMIMSYENVTAVSVAGMYNVTEATMRNKLSSGLDLGETLKLLESMGWSMCLKGPHNTTIPITYADYLEDKKKYDEGFHRKGYNAPYTPVDQRK